jgi:hypothetical protein
MSAKDIRNLPSSVLARLLNLAKQTGDNYQVLLAKFVSERFLYRLGKSALRDRFVLKGVRRAAGMDGGYLPRSHCPG